MRRGDIVLAAASGDYGKPRPFVVVQATDLLDFSDSIILCPITSHLTGAKLRVLLEPTADNALRARSEVMADKLQALRTERVRQVIGRVSDAQTAAINAGLTLILGLRG